MLYVYSLINFNFLVYFFYLCIISGVKPESIVSALSKDGTLKVTAPRITSATSIGGFRKTRGAIEEDVFVPPTTQV